MKVISFSWSYYKADRDRNQKYFLNAILEMSCSAKTYLQTNKLTRKRNKNDAKNELPIHSSFVSVYQEIKELILDLQL